MASVLLIGQEQKIAAQIDRTLVVEPHRTKQAAHNIGVRDLNDVDIVFAGGEPSQYLSLLRRVRDAWPALPWLLHAFLKPLRGWTPS